MVRVGTTRIGHRVGGYYLSTPITGHNAGKQIRIGHRLPGGFYASVPVTVTKGQPQPPAPLGVQIAATAVTAFLIGWLTIACRAASAWKPSGVGLVGRGVVVRAEPGLYGKLWRAGLRVRLRYLVWLLLTVELSIFHRPFSAMSW